MKNLLTTIILAVMMLFTATTMDAQTYANAQQAYDYCKMYVQQGNDAYAGKCFEDAQDFYEKALACNAECPDKKYMSNRKIYKKIGDCKYAIEHDGKTRQEANAETVGAILGVVAAVGTVAAIASEPHHEVIEVHHHGPHHPHHWGW